MNNAFIQALEAIKEQIAAKEVRLLAELLPLKNTANQLCKLAGVPDAYIIDGTDAPAAGGKKTLKFKEDQFFNKSLAGSVVAYMEAREEAAMERPASVDDIYDALVSGGFKFEGSTGNPDNSKRALKIALTKNTAQFVKIGEKFALKKWYGMRASRKAANGGSAEEESTEAAPIEEVEPPSEEA